MDRTTALRLERIRQAAEATHRVVDLETRRHVAVLVVALTVAGSALVGGVAGQLPPVAAVLAFGTSGPLVVVQVRELRWLAEQDWHVSLAAVAAIDKLIGDQDERDADDEARDEGGP